VLPLLNIFNQNSNMNNSDLIEYLDKKGKRDNESWEDLAKLYGFRNGEAARGCWKNYRKKHKVDKIKEQTEKDLYIKELEDKVVKFEEDFKNGTGNVTYTGSVEIKTKEQLFKECNIDETKWNVDKMVCNAWGKEGNQSWQIKAWLSSKKGVELFQEKFVNFLKDYKPTHYSSPIRFGINKPKGCLVINKQDEHLNKYDIHGDNDINDRFLNVYNKIDIILQQATISNNLEKIVYIIGSDEFNSEWSSCTTKGTPQTNILSYENSFEQICDYEIAMIEKLSSCCKNLEVLYIQGNHDEYVGWHLAHFLKKYFQLNDNISIDTENVPTKYVRYSNTAMMFNHGDCVKPQKLTNLFSVQFRKEWSLCDNFYIFSGDKHHEKSQDFNGITFYQLPALSTATGKWDNKEGHIGSKNELTAFLIEEGKGRTNILKQPL